MKMVIVTGCVVGIAHSGMAAAALSKHAEALGIEVRTEEQGGYQVPRRLKMQDIAEADVVIIAANIAISGRDRFQGKKILEVDVHKALLSPKEVIAEAVKLAEEGSE